jgi:hypothetical protein
MPGRGLPDSFLSDGYETAYQVDVENKGWGKAIFSVERMNY